MRKVVVGLFLSLFLCLSLGSGQAFADNQGTFKKIPVEQFGVDNATIEDRFYESPYAIFGKPETGELYTNTAGKALTVKVNVSDWEKLQSEGKLDGLRFIVKDSEAIKVGKVTGKEIKGLDPREFFS